MWPFTKIEKHQSQKQRRPIMHITVDLEVAPDEKIMSGTAYFPGEREMAKKAGVPADALGELVLANAERLKLELIDPNVRPLPTVQDAKREQLYLAVEEQPDHHWVAMIGGLNIDPPPCTCPHNNVDWHKSKAWENQNRAVGMMVLEWQHLIRAFVLYDYDHPIRLRHPDDPDWSGIDCCCCGGDCGA